MSSTRPLWVFHLCAIGTCLIWSFSYIHIIWLAEHVNPVQMVIVRNYFMAPAIVGLWIWRRPKIHLLTWRQWLLVIGITLASGPAYHLPLAWGGDEGRANASMIGLIIATVPVHVGWLAWVLLGERLTWRRIAGLMLGLGGVCVVLFGRLVREDGGSLASLELGQIEGAAALVVAAIVAGLNTVGTRGARTFIGPFELVCLSGTLALLICLVATPFSSMGELSTMPPLGWWAAFYLGFIAIGVAYAFWFSALSGGLPAASVAMYLFIPCILSALWSWLWQENTIGVPFFVGATMVLGGLVLGVLKRKGAGAKVTAMTSSEGG